jgi:cell division protein FtsI/penicillin-binding protein 2
MPRHADPKARPDRIDRLIRWTGLLVCIALGATLLRVGQLQVAPGERLAAHAGDRVASRPVQGYRGEILDRRGRLLSTSRLGFRAFVDPERIDRARLDELIVQLADATGLEPWLVGARLVRALETNDTRRAALGRREPPAATPLDQLRALFGRPDAETTTPVEVAPETEEGDAPPPLIRYLAMGGVLTDDEAARVRAIALPGVHLERRPVREYPTGEIVASILGKVGFENHGLMGAELTLDESLQASDGRARYVRDAWGRPLWIERGQWVAARHGRHQRLAIDLELQRIAHEELTRGMQDADAAGGRLVMLDPLTGEVLAMLDLYRDVGELPEFPWADAEPDGPAPPAYDPMTRYRAIPPDPRREIHPALGRNRCVEDIYEPGSTFKPFVWSLVVSAGAARLDEVFDTEGGRWRNERGRRFEDVTRRDEMTWREVLINSSNIGMVKGSARLEHRRLRAGLLGFGFGARTGVALPGESAGRVTPASAWTNWTHESVASGYEIAVTPIQLARAYCALARTGELAGTVPSIRLVATDGPSVGGDAIVRAIAPDVAETTRRTLRPVAEKVEHNMASLFDPPETGWRYQMWGKSGTANIALGAAPEGKRLPRGMRGYLERQYNSSFVAGAPLERPRLVVVVVIDDPGPGPIAKRRHYGSWVAGPVARRVLERSLTYLGVEPDLRTEADRPVASAR